MSHVQTGIVADGQFNGFHGRCHAGFLTTYQRMCPNPRIIAVMGLEFRHVAVNNARILTMSHDRQRSGTGEDVVKCLVTVNEHIARTAAHEELDARNAVSVKFTE